MTIKCPKCYRPIGTWNKDPILLPDGSKYKWQDDTTLIEEPNIEQRKYKGIYQISELEVQELQDALEQLEIDNLLEIDRTIFSSLNTSGIFQITGKHIKEMRDSIEKLLNILGLSKIDYFNYDEEGNHIIHPLGDKLNWTDPITNATDLQKFQVKAIHIEDLRHYFAVSFIYISATIDPPVYKLSAGNNLQIISSYPDTIQRSAIAVDDIYLYTAYQNNPWVYKRNKQDGSVIQSCYIPAETGDAWNNRLRALCVDEEYVWLLREIPYTGYGTYITKIDKLTMTIVEQSFIGIIDFAWHITNDSNFLYTNSYGSRFTKINKITKEKIVYNLPNILNTQSLYGLGMDENYFYFITNVFIGGEYAYSRLIRCTKNFTNPTLINIGLQNKSFNDIYSSILVDINKIYILHGYQHTEEYYTSTVKLYVIDKETYSTIYTTAVLDGQTMSVPGLLGGYFGSRMDSEYFYRKCLTF